MFQSTHPRGVRRTAYALAHILQKGFNPRTRVGCDMSNSDSDDNQLIVSIHAPAWGATS